MSVARSYLDLRDLRVCRTSCKLLHHLVLILHLGCAIVTSDDAYLFTDGRYFLQAEKQLDQEVHWN